MRSLWIRSHLLFGSDRSSRSHNLRPSVRSVQVCLELSIFKQSVISQSAVSQQSARSQIAVRAFKSVSKSLKYCVLFNNFSIRRESNNEVSVDSAGGITGENFREITPRPQSASHEESHGSVIQSVVSLLAKKSIVMFAWQLWSYLGENQYQEESY